MKMALNRRILLLILIPSVAISTLFVLWFGYTQISNDRQALDQQLLLSSERLQISLEFSLISQNKPLMLAIAQRALNENNVRSITILDGNGDKLVQVGPNPLAPFPTVLPADPLKLVSEGSFIYLTEAQHSGASLYAPENSMPIPSHWIALELSTDKLKVQQYHTVLVNLLLLLFTGAAATIAAIVVSNLVISPVTNLLQAVRKIVAGDFSVRVQDTPDAEMQELGAGVNNLVDALDRAHIDLQQGIDQATHDIRAMLETLEIQNIELEIARREAIDASRIKSEFLANMSHEIRTPLNGIIGFANLLIKTNMTRKQDDYARTIQSSSQSLLAIINDVLDFAKIEAGKLSLDMSTINLKASVEDVLVMIAPEAHKKQIELIPLYYHDVPEFVVGDPLRIKQVITNLVGNAVKFTSAGQVCVRVTLEGDFGNSVTIRISITDTGIGLDQAQQKALFNAFQQADTSTTREYGGTGLGLVISKKLVEQMGGDMGIDSEAGVGSTFWFTIRVDIAERDAAPANIALAHKTVVIHDANKTTQTALRRTLESFHLKVTETAQVSDWLATTQRIVPNYAIIGFKNTDDIGSGLHTGLADLAAKHICTLVLTNGFENSINMKLIEQYASGCLSKPFQTERLLQMLSTETFADNETQLKPLYQSGGRILAVDDNESNLKLICTLIEDTGIEAIAASSGAQAVDLVTEQDFDLILMDIQMPGMDGLEATKRIRDIRLKGRKRIPIIAVTAHALDSEREHLLRNGFDDYLTKPLSDANLIAAITKWTALSFEQSSFRAAPPKPTQLGEETVDTRAEAVVDIAMAMDRANYKADLAEDMFSSLVILLAKDQVDMQQSFADNDPKTLLELVHKLHGAAHYCGVPELKHRAEALEILLKTGKYQFTEKHLVALQEEMVKVIEWDSQHDFASEVAAQYPPKIV